MPSNRQIVDGALVKAAQDLIELAHQKLGEAQAIARQIRSDQLREQLRLQIQEIEAPQWVEPKRGRS